MKQRILPVLIAAFFTLFLFSCKKESASAPNAQGDKQALSTPDESGFANAVSTLSYDQLAGKTYLLRYIKNDVGVTDNKWVPANDVGLNFIPNSFFYTNNKLSFATDKQQMDLYTSSPFSVKSMFNVTINGNNLRLVYSQSFALKNIYKATVTDKGLQLLDLDTPTGWRFEVQ